MKANIRIKIAIALLIVSVVFCVSSMATVPANVGGLLIGLSTNLFVLALGIVIINQHFESSARKEAVLAIFYLTGHDISILLDKWLHLCWRQFGGDRYKKIIDEYERSGKNPEILSDDVRERIYKLSLSEGSEIKLNSIFYEIDKSLKELSGLIGWSLDAELLASAHPRH